MAVTRYGLSFSEFWDSTPREFDMLCEASVYNIQLGMNHVRHIVAAVANTVVDRKKKPNGYKPEDIMRLHLIDDKVYTKEEAKSEQEKTEAALVRMKTMYKKRDDG